MIELVRMDLRRMVRGKSLWILIAVLLGLNAATYMLLSLMTDPEMLAAMAAQGAEVTAKDYAEGARIASMSMLDFLRENLFNGSFWILIAAFGAGLFTVRDFTSGYSKNLFALLRRRETYVLAKAVSLLAMEAAALAAVFAAAALVRPLTLFRQWGGTPLDWLLLYAEGVTVGWAISLLMLFWAVLLRGDGPLVTAAMVFGSGLVPILAGALCGLLALPDPTRYTIYAASQMPAAGWQPGQLLQVGGICAAWGLVYIALSAMVLEKSDIA